jgi:hypothetical protein
MLGTGWQRRHDERRPQRIVKIARDLHRVRRQARRRPGAAETPLDRPRARCSGAAVVKNRLGDLLAYTSGYELLVVCDQRRCCFKVDLGRGEVHSFAQAGEDDGIGIVSFLSESTGDSLPTPAAEPTTTDQHVSGHPKDLLYRYAEMGQEPWSTTR